MLEHISICLVALYLRGVPRPFATVRRRWVGLVSTLRQSDCSGDDLIRVLAHAGYTDEAMVLSTKDILQLASGLVDSGKVLTAVDTAYPHRWLERLGDAAPPALWKSGPLPTQALIGIVGSRHIEADVRHFAKSIGLETVRLGYAVVSGGAIGCDTAGAHGATEGGGQVLEILPYGITQYSETDRCALSVCAPDEFFSTPSAMERNALIYAASEQTVIAHARFKQGGTWIGAVQANRKHLCPLIVREDGSPASRALIGLGGTPIREPSLLADALANPPFQRGLFGIG